MPSYFQDKIKSVTLLQWVPLILSPQVEDAFKGQTDRHGLILCPASVPCLTAHQINQFTLTAGWASSQTHVRSHKSGANLLSNFFQLLIVDKS